MAANNIALMPLQRESVADSYLSALAQRQQMDTQAQANQRAQAQEQRQQTEFDMNRKLQAVDQLGAALDGVQDGDAAGFEKVKAFAIQNGLLDPNEAAKYNVGNLPQIRAMSQQARQMMAQRQKAQMDEREFGLKERQVASSIRANDAQAMAARALVTKRSSPGGAGGEFDNTTFDNISNLRKEYQGATKDFGTVRDAYGRIKATSGSASPAGDIAMIYAFMKMLDPGSVVRETEFAVAQNAKPLLDRLGISWDSVKSAWQGNRLQPQVRQDFLNQANSLYSQQLGQYNNVRSTYGTLSQRFGFDPSLVLTDQTGGIQAAAPQPPQSFTAGGSSGFAGADRDLISEADRILGIGR